jgi:hypothetical protein
MPTADFSQTAYLARKKSFLISRFATANPNVFLQSPPRGVDQSIYLQKRLGQIQYVLQSPTGHDISGGPCCTEPRG